MNDRVLKFINGEIKRYFWSQSARYGDTKAMPGRWHTCICFFRPDLHRRRQEKAQRFHNLHDCFMTDLIKKVQGLLEGAIIVLAQNTLQHQFNDRYSFDF